jgi:predicted transglutaminase-like cysteine proteinase
LLLSIVAGLGVSAAPPGVAAEGVLPAGFSARTPGFIGHSPRFLAGQRQTAPPAGAQGLCRTYPWACASATGRGPLTRAQLETVVAVNRRVNRTVREISDRAQYGVEEHWALPTARGGDCEDFALLKKRDLIRAGLPPQRLLLATVLDRRLQSHAVLVLRTDRGDFVLDNLTTEIKPWLATGYTFLKVQNPQAKGSWVGALTGGVLSS